MRFKKIALALFACMALGAFAANAAQASGLGWTIGEPGVLIAKGVHQPVSCHKHGTTTLLLTSTLLGSPVEISAEGIDCLENAGSINPATIDNTTTPNHSEGVLTFTNVKVVKPAHCETGGTTHDLTTLPLTDTVIMDPTAGSTAVFDRFFPEEAGGAFVTITLEGTECALAGNAAAVKGSACGESVHTNTATPPAFVANKTGENMVVQTLLFGAAQQTTGNSEKEPCKLTFGPAAATLDGAVDNELAGANAGKKFGSD